jgi:hypothetical protein
MFNRLFSNCFLVRGIKRSVICDIQKHRVIFIPNQLSDILEEENVFDINSLVIKYGEINRKQIIEYISFLDKQGVLQKALSKEIFDNFPAYNLYWDWPSKVSNFIVDINYQTTIDIIIPRIIECSENLMCQNLQIRFFELENSYLKILETIKSLLLFSKESMYRCIELVLPYTKDFVFDDIIELMNCELRIIFITVYSAPESFLRLKRKHPLKYIFC